MLTDLCDYLRNWFCRAQFFGRFKIENGVIKLYNDGDMGLLNGQYIRIVRSVFNDGIWQYGETIDGLQDEVFDGAVWALAIPHVVVDLADRIAEWKKQYYSVSKSPYSSENISASSYGYVKGSVESVKSMDWRIVFAEEIAPWRKI